MSASDDLTPAQALTRLKAALLTLKDSGDDGFEGLAATLLGTATAIPFRLAASGSQGGQDGRAESAGGAISFEAKLYRSRLSKAVVTAKVADILASDDPPDLWVLAATVKATSQTVATLRGAFGKVETSLLVLDWPANTTLPPLALLCAMARDVCSDFIARHARTPVDQTALTAALAKLAALPAFAARAAELRAELGEPQLGLATARAANHAIYRAVFARTDDARHRFGQPLAPAAHHALAPIERAQRNLLDAILTAPPISELVVLAGNQGCGKSWLVAQSWLATTEPPFLIFLTAAQAFAAMQLSPAELIAQQLIEQSGDIATAGRRERWVQRLNRWCRHPAETPRILVVVDGLNERARADWAPWLSRLTSFVGSIGGRVVATCRARFYKRLDDRLSVPKRRIDVGDFGDAELNSALAAHDIAPNRIAKRVRPSLRNPRILGIALELLSTAQIGAAEELSIERLLFEHVRAHASNPVDGETPWQFKRLLADHARLIRERIEKQVTDDQLLFDSYDFKDAPRYDLPRDLLPVVEERFFVGVEGEPDHYQLTDDGLVYALGIATINELRKAERNRRSVAERLAEIIEPVAALDLVTDVLFAAALIASVDAEVSQTIAAALLARHAMQQNADEDSYPAYCGIVRNISSAALDALFMLAVGDPHAQHKDWLVDALRRARADREVWAIIAARLNSWLRLYSLNSAHGLMPGERDAAKRAEAKAETEAKIATRLTELTPCERAILERMTRDDGVDGTTLSEDAFAILAGMPLVGFADGLMCWALARSINGGYHVPWKDFAFVVQHNRIDWFETRDALLAAAACFAADDASRTGKWALVSILRATGDADDGSRAEIIANALTPEWEHFEGWRLVERYCATDPCDPASERPNNIDATAQSIVELDPTALVRNRWTGEHEHFLSDAAPGLARFAPDNVVAVTRAVVTDMLDRPSNIATLGIPLLGSATVLIDDDTVADMLSRAATLSHPRELVSDADTKDWVVSQYLLVTAFAHLDGDTQAQRLIDLPEHGPPLVQLDSVFRPASAAMIDRLLDRAIASSEEHRLLMALAFVRGSDSPINPGALARIRQLADHPQGSVRGLALQISADHPDEAQLAAFVASGWSAATHDPREHFYIRWHGSSMIIAAAKRRLLTGAEAIARISPDRYGAAASTLGADAVGKPLASLIGQATLRVLDAVMPFRPPRVSLADDADADAVARFSLEDDDVDLPFDQRFARINESDEAFAARQQAGWNRFRDFESALNKSGAELILRDIGSAALQAVADADLAALQVIARQLLDVPASRLPRVANLASRIARALSFTDPDLAVALFRRCAGHEAYVRITRSIGSVPLMTWDIWHSADSAVMDGLRRERLERCTSDHALASEILAACHAGRQPWLEAYATSEIANGHPVATARALTILGFTDASETADATIARFGNHGGMVGRAAEAARYAYDRNLWSRHWYQQLVQTESRIDFWRYATLLGKIADARMLLWTEDAEDGGLLERFGHSLNRPIERRIEAWKKKRGGKLFGRDQPRDIYLEPAPNGFDLSEE